MTLLILDRVQVMKTYWTTN